MPIRPNPRYRPLAFTAVLFGAPLCVLCLSPLCGVLTGSVPLWSYRAHWAEGLVLLAGGVAGLAAVVFGVKALRQPFPPAPAPLPIPPEVETAVRERFAPQQVSANEAVKGPGNVQGPVR